MYFTEDKTCEIYESIAVVVIYLPNITEMLFEKERELLIEEYREILKNCLKIMRQEEGYRDLIIHSTYLYGIFHNRFSGKEEGVVNMAGRIHEMLQNINKERSKCMEKICFGIGVASGSGGWILLEEAGRKDRIVWFGKVLEDARALAQMALCDGRGRIRVAEEMFYDIFKR